MEGRLKEAGNTEEGREFQRRGVEGKKPSLSRLIIYTQENLGKILLNCTARKFQYKLHFLVIFNVL